MDNLRTEYLAAKKEATRWDIVMLLFGFLASITLIVGSAIWAIYWQLL